VDKLRAGKSAGITISGGDADKLIRAGSGDAALLYIHILRAGGETGLTDAARALGMTESQLSAAAAKLRELGLVAGDEPREAPPYTAGELKDALESRADFRSVTDEAQRLMGRPLSESDLRRLLTIYDRMGLEADAMLLLIVSCCEDCREKYGPGRVPTMGQIEKAARIWQDHGVHTGEEAEQYLRRRSELRGEFQRARRALGIGDRTVAPSERAFLESWLQMGLSVELIERAYDVTVSNTGKLAWKYMDTVLRSWHDRGVQTPEDVDRADKKRRETRAAGDDSHEKQAVLWLQNRRKNGD